MLTPIDNDELEDICYDMSESTYTYYPIARDYFYDLYNTGCRPMELLTISLWDYSPHPIVSLQPLKGNNLRYFNLTDLSESLQFGIQNNVHPYQNLTYRQLRSLLQKLIPYPTIQTEFKSAIDYMFRYNRVKIMHADGETDVFIQLWFGWINSFIPQIYYNQQLYYFTP